MEAIQINYKDITEDAKISKSSKVKVIQDHAKVKV